MDMKRAKLSRMQLAATVSACVLLLAAGVVQGLSINRWGAGSELQDAAKRMQQIPAAFGEWSSEEMTIPEDQVEQAEIYSYLSRRYVHRSTGNSVSISLVVGQAGPIAVHPPTACFVGAGWSLPEAPTEFNAQVGKGNTDSLGQFSVGDFARNHDAIPEFMRTFWAWSADGHWMTPDNPRFEFARSPYLYKLYVSRSMIRLGDPIEDDVTVSFLREFLPIVEQTLFPHEKT